MNRSLSVLLFSFMIVAMVAPIQADAEQGVSAMGQDRVDHAQYDRLLKQYVALDGLVAYKQWKANDEATLDAYLGAMGEVNPDGLADNAEELAFWINVYNALTIKAILDFYPIKSIKDRVGGTYNVWKDYKITIAGVSYSLDTIEHQILRKKNEPRIHFAIVCASYGCPPLRNEAYTGDRLNEQLAVNSQLFFSNPDHFRIDSARKTIYLSAILDWFKGDFGKDKRALLSAIKPFVADTEARGLLEQDGLKIKYADYDWRLNDQEKPSR